MALYYWCTPVESGPPEDITGEAVIETDLFECGRCGRGTIRVTDSDPGSAWEHSYTVIASQMTLWRSVLEDCPAPLRHDCPCPAHATLKHLVLPCWSCLSRPGEPCRGTKGWCEARTRALGRLRGFELPRRIERRS